MVRKLRTTDGNENPTKFAALSSTLQPPVGPAVWRRSRLFSANFKINCRISLSVRGAKASHHGWQRKSYKFADLFPKTCDYRELSLAFQPPVEPAVWKCSRLFSILFWNWSPIGAKFEAKSGNSLNVRGAKASHHEWQRKSHKIRRLSLK